MALNRSLPTPPHFKDRLYAMASSWDVFQRDGHGAEHLGPTRPFLRRVYDRELDANWFWNTLFYYNSHDLPSFTTASSFGTIFWLGDVPLGYESYGFLPLSAMDATTQADMQTLACVVLIFTNQIDSNPFPNLHSLRHRGALINTTTLSDNGEPNERSLYAVPKPNADGSRTLVQLMRAGNSSLPLMLASTCNVPGVCFPLEFESSGIIKFYPTNVSFLTPKSWVPPPPSGNTYKYACRPGTGITQLNTLQGEKASSNIFKVLLSHEGVFF